MKLSELINQLIELAVQYNPDLDDISSPCSELTIDPEVNMAHQPTWPLVHSISHIAVEDQAEDLLELNETLADPELTDDDRMSVEGEIKLLSEKSPTLYIVEGAYLEYGSRKLWDHE